jgi:threonine dehydratase
VPALINLEQIEDARRRIQDSIARTPCEHSVALSEMFRAKIYCKLDNLQATGSFKERGAANKLRQLTPAQCAKGVVTASAGNHGLGVAYQARQLGIAGTVVMPKNAPLIKRANITRLGGRVVLHGDTFSDALQHARQIASETGQTFVHSFDDRDIIIGQGTLGLEIAEQVPGLDLVIVPVGGGGLIAGVATAVKALCPKARIIGVEPARCASMQAALAAKKAVTIETTPTIADGLAVQQVGALALEIATPLIDELVMVTEDEIAQAILMLLEVEKTVVEGAGATSLAAMVKVAGQTVALPLCGGNIDMTAMANIIERGLAKDGRLVCLRTFVNDRPGALAAVARIIADAGVSVKDVQHDRAFAGLEPGGVEIAWILETRGHEHITELVAALRAKGVRVATPE